MRRYAKQKVMVWLLTALWVFPLTVKALHTHHYEACPETTDHAQHNPCSDCPLCLFTLSSCTETPSPGGVLFQPSFILLTPASPQEKPCTSYLLSPIPRGPPPADRA